MKVYWVWDVCCPAFIVEKKEGAWGEIEIPADLKSRMAKADDDFWKVQSELEDYIKGKKVFKKGGK